MSYTPNEMFYEGFIIDFLQQVNTLDSLNKQGDVLTVPMILSDKSI